MIPVPTQQNNGSSSSSQSVARMIASSILDNDGITLLNQIHEILATKAPEVIQLLDKFLGKLPLLAKDLVESDKRERSVVFYGIPEAEGSLSPSLRQAHTEKYISRILDTLDIETRPVEVYRMGRGVEGKPRVVKLVNYVLYRTIRRSFVRKSMTIDERNKERDLRKRARELNEKEFNGKKIYVVYRGEIIKVKDRLGKAGGGVCVFLHNRLLFDRVVFDYSALGSDVLCFDICLPASRKQRFLLVYRPPRSTSFQDDQLIEIMSDLVASVPHNTIVLGDFNLDIDWHTSTTSNLGAQKFLTVFENLSLNQHVNFPTRENRILDLILADAPCISDVASHAPLSTSDHNIISFRVSSLWLKSESILYRDFKGADKEKIKHELGNLDWMQILNNYVDIDDVYCRFAAIIRDIIDRYVPQRKLEKNASARYPKHIVNLFEQRDRLFQQLPQPSTSPYFLEISKNLDHHVKRFLAYKTRKLAKDDHMKKLFDYIKKVKASSSAHQILEDSEGKKYSTDLEKAEALANYFA
ncbi:hypothetical protein OSTOST_20786, partial [Ostertagia ostertagi]